MADGQQVPAGDDGQQQQQQAVSAVSVKLPEFWAQDAELWFARVDSVFRRARITASLTKFDYVMEKLLDEVLISIKDIVRAVNDDTEDPYNLVKNRLLGTYMPSPWALANKLLDYPEIGGGKSSTMMAAMLALLPEGEQPGFLFKSLFLRRLPVELREHLVSREFDSPHDMAKFADGLWDARNASTSAVSAVGRRGGSPKRQQSPYRGKKKANRNGLCFYHHKFGVKASRCEPPCNWSGNDQAADDN